MCPRGGQRIVVFLFSSLFLVLIFRPPTYLCRRGGRWTDTGVRNSITHTPSFGVWEGSLQRQGHPAMYRQEGVRQAATWFGARHARMRACGEEFVSPRGYLKGSCVDIEKRAIRAYAASMVFRAQASDLSWAKFRGYDDISAADASGMCEMDWMTDGFKMRQRAGEVMEWVCQRVLREHLSTKPREPRHFGPGCCGCGWAEAADGGHQAT